eukprot:scaffold204860_cov29-Tisochrysis_lutea.AAC.6
MCVACAFLYPSVSLHVEQRGEQWRWSLVDCRGQKATRMQGRTVIRRTVGPRAGVGRRSRLARIATAWIAFVH